MLELATNDIETNFNTIFRVVLRDADPAVRKNAIDGLGEEENSALIDPLIDLLKTDPSEAVQAASASALGRFALLAELDRLSKPRHAQIYKALIVQFPGGALKIHWSTKRRWNRWATWPMTRWRCISEPRLPRTNPDSRRSALIAMGRSQDRRFAEFVRTELQALQPDTRLAAVEAIGELEDEEAVRDLKSLLDDSDRLVQMATLTALAQIGSPDAKTALQQAVLSADEEFSKAAGEALEMYEFWRGEIDFSITNFDEEDLKPRRVWKRRDTAGDSAADTAMQASAMRAT